MEIITSRDNAKVKYLSSLKDTKISRREGLVLVEGLRACEDALKYGIEPVLMIADENHSDFVKQSPADSIILSEACFKKISYTVNPQGVALLAGRRNDAQDFPFKGDGSDIYLCVEDIRDPGNLGTMIRIADAFDFTALLVTRNTVDSYNDKVIRASMGSIWKVRIMEFEDAGSMLQELNKRHITTIAAELNGDDLSSGLDLPAAYFIGNEGAGLKSSTIERCDLRVKIRMDGRAESLNAASAASIMGYVLQTMRGQG